MIRRCMPLLVLFLTLLASSSLAATKAYDSSHANGRPGDSILASTTLCPPVQTALDDIIGFSILDDDGLGSVTLAVSIQGVNVIELGADQLTPVYGPGAFVFLDSKTTSTNAAPGSTPHVGLPGSGTDPGEAAVWGIISSWSLSGATFCISSPVAICNDVTFTHGVTILPTLTSGTFNLGTWAFDAIGDDEATTPYIFRTGAGGLTNNQIVMRGAFHGSSLPALPLVGLGALALSLAVIGGRSLMGRK